MLITQNSTEELQQIAMLFRISMLDLACAADLAIQINLKDCESRLPKVAGKA